MSGLVLSLAACAVFAPEGEPVAILTGELGCYAGGETGSMDILAVDASYGTSFLGRPVLWPAGYTARRVGNDVVVLDADRNVKARTGRTYFISRAYSGDLPPYRDDAFQHGGPPSNAFPAAVECGYPWDFIDCGSEPPMPADAAERCGRG